MIDEVKTFRDDKERRVTCRIDINQNQNAASENPQYRFYGHGFVPVAAVTQVFPFEFLIPVDTTKTIYEAAEEAFSKYDEIFKKEVVVAKQRIHQKIIDESKRIHLPGNDQAVQAAHRVMNAANGQSRG